MTLSVTDKRKKSLDILKETMADIDQLEASTINLFTLIEAVVSGKSLIDVNKSTFNNLKKLYINELNKLRKNIKRLGPKERITKPPSKINIIIITDRFVNFLREVNKGNGLIFLLKNHIDELDIMDLYQLSRLDGSKEESLDYFKNYVRENLNKSLEELAEELKISNLDEKIIDLNMVINFLLEKNAFIDKLFIKLYHIITFVSGDKYNDYFHPDEVWYEHFGEGTDTEYIVSGEKPDAIETLEAEWDEAENKEELLEQKFGSDKTLRQRMANYLLNRNKSVFERLAEENDDRKKEPAYVPKTENDEKWGLRNNAPMIMVSILSLPRKYFTEWYKELEAEFSEKRETIEQMFQLLSFIKDVHKTINKKFISVEKSKVRSIMRS
ncbi:MAG: hypothetical protein KatS3mg101_0921 [Patescibacteria group bacterium]|nr:MAG: hypothetical protein KatS3mg101_0921 [Patescibacteria group bacterium]